MFRSTTRGGSGMLDEPSDPRRSGTRGLEPVTSRGFECVMTIDGFEAVPGTFEIEEELEPVTSLGFDRVITIGALAEPVEVYERGGLGVYELLQLPLPGAERRCGETYVPSAFA